MKIFRLLRNLRILSKVKFVDGQIANINYEEVLRNLLYYIPNANVQRPKVMSDLETIDFLNDSNFSVVRYGDGEIEIMDGNSIPYQEYDIRLACRLKEIITVPQDNLIVGINYWYYYPVYNEKDADLIKNFQLYNMPKCRSRLAKYINYHTQYCDAGFTSFKEYDDKRECFFDKVRELWSNKNILIVTCKEAIDALSYDVYDTAKDKQYLFIPNKNAYSCYQQIYEGILKYSKDRLIVLMAGPTAKVLAADLSLVGYRVLDMGHIAKSYDYYLKKIPKDTGNVSDFYSPDL